MNRIATFVVENARLAWTFALAVIAAIAFLAGQLAIDYRQQEQLSHLQTSADRFGNEIMSYTLNGNLMGAVSMLGLTDGEIKSEAQGSGTQTIRLLNLLKTVGQSYDSGGVFVVGKDGIVKSSWDSSGKPSTGLNVKFRPYFQMAMQGTENIYAAVSLARGDRVLYFTAPVYAENSNNAARTGAVVARTNLDRIDELLKNKTDIALLLSPQGVVFASNRSEWIGSLIDTPTPERINKIRELKQFGNMFENKEPSILPISSKESIQALDGSRYAVAVTRVQWNDPSGDWKLVLMEDLSRTIPIRGILGVSAAAGCLALLIALLALFVLRGTYRQAKASRELALYASAQAATAAQKNKLAAASMRMQQADNAHELGQIFLGEAHRMLGIFQGVIYAFAQDGDHTMECVAAYACHGDIPKEIALGEGLLGQCAVDRKSLLLRAPDESFWKIRSGLGETLPAMLMIEPILLNDNLIGVLELSSPRALDDIQQAGLAEMIPVLAMNLEILRRNRMTEAQLSATANSIRELEYAKSAERINRITLDHELEVMQLKREVNALAEAAGKEAPYSTTLIETTGDHRVLPVSTNRLGHPSDSGRPLQLGDLVDLQELQTLFSSYCESIGIAAAVIDLEGKVLAASRWQRACTDFHRVNPESCARCIESDTELATQLQEGKDFSLYRCKNGMTDCASPIIVEGQHLANVFIGQFHLGPPDLAFFAEQAKQYGYDEDEYLKAVREAPIMDESRLPVILGFLTGFAHMLSAKSLANQSAGQLERLRSSDSAAASSPEAMTEQATDCLEDQGLEKQA